MDDSSLRYKFLNAFDSAMNFTEEKYGWLIGGPADISWCHEGDKIIAFERNRILFVFNFHYERSFTDYRVAVSTPGTYKIVLSTDDKEFGGFGRVDTSLLAVSMNEGHAGKSQFIHTYLPARTAFVYVRLG